MHDLIEALDSLLRVTKTLFLLDICVFCFFMKDILLLTVSKPRTIIF